MKAPQPRTQLILWLVLAGVGLALFFSGEYRAGPFSVGWIGTFLFLAWLVLGHALKLRWAGKVLSDECDARIELAASQRGRSATAVVVIGIAVLLGFSDTGRLQQFSYPYIAQMLMVALLGGVWFDQLIAAILYVRDRRGVQA